MKATENLSPNFSLFFKKRVTFSFFISKIFSPQKIKGEKTMKRLAAIFLSVLLLFSIVACNVAHITEDTSNNINDTSDTYEPIIDEPAHANPEHYANFSSYNEIIRTYKAIVKCFNYYTVEEYQNGEYRSTLDFPSDEIEEIYKKNNNGKTCNIVLLVDALA